MISFSNLTRATRASLAWPQVGPRAGRGQRCKGPGCRAGAHCPGVQGPGVQARVQGSEAELRGCRSLWCRRPGEGVQGLGGVGGASLSPKQPLPSSLPRSPPGGATWPHPGQVKAAPTASPPPMPCTLAQQAESRSSSVASGWGSPLRPLRGLGSGVGAPGPQPGVSLVLVPEPSRVGPLAPGGRCPAAARGQGRPRPGMNRAWGQVVSATARGQGSWGVPPSAPTGPCGLRLLAPPFPAPQSKVKVEVAQPGGWGQGLSFLSFSLSK